MKPSPRFWRIVRRTAFSLFGIVVVLGLVVGGLGVKAVRDAFPQHEGTLTVNGLSAPVTVYRDKYGIPQLFAKTDADLYARPGLHCTPRTGSGRWTSAGT